MTDRAPETPPRATPRNVVLITLDTTRADALGAYGQRRPSSPHIDRIASEGLLFENAMSASPSTLPSHATIMTGLLPFGHGARSNTGYVLGQEHSTLAEILESHGYTTGAEVAAPVIGRDTGLDQGFRHYRDPGDFDIVFKKVFVADPSADTGRRLIEAQYRDGSDVTKRGLEFIDRHRNTGEPFFLWLHYFDPHVPYQAPAEFRIGMEKSDYHAEVRYADHQVGRIVDALRQRGLDEHTLVVLTSDHGEGLGEHDEATHSYYVYEATIRVPLIFWGPGSVPEGVRIDTPVRTADIAPSILGWLGLPSSSGLHGRNLLPLSDEKTDPSPPGPGYAESIKPLALFDSSMLRTLRRGDWKYVHKLDPELYRLADDPGELRNLASQHPERVREMRMALSDLVRSQSAARDSRTDIDEAQRAQLQALGYLGIETPDSFNDADDLSTLRGPDPRAVHSDVVIMERAHGHIFEGNGAAATDDLRALYERHPNSDAVRESLLKALFSAERWKEVATLAEQVLDDDITHVIATEALGTALGHLGREDELAAHWQRAAAILPCDSGMSSRHGLVLFEAGREAERITILEDALERCPDNPAAMNDLSYALSTTPNSSLLDGERALELARRAVASVGMDRPDFLDTLACAQARTGDYETALRTSERAVEMLRMRKYPAEVIRSFEVHRKSFEAREPVVDAPTAHND